MENGMKEERTHKRNGGYWISFERDWGEKYEDHFNIRHAWREFDYEDDQIWIIEIWGNERV